METRLELKARLLRERLTDDPPWATYGRATDMHEFIYAKRHFRGLSAKKKRYMDSELNCAILSPEAHQQWGDTKRFRLWFMQLQIERYGYDAMREYVENPPLKIKRRIEEFLP